MNKQNVRRLCAAIGLLIAFVLWTVAVGRVDVRAIGPRGSAVGFAGLNGFFHTSTGVHMGLYTVTDWLGLVPICFALGFAITGLAQWIKRRNFCKVDADILALGGFYLLVMAAYVYFEMHVVNFRPVLIDGYLKASYPSSTTMLALCVMPTAILQFRRRMHNVTLRRTLNGALWAFTAFMVMGRLISGVHWLSDIVGGVLLSAGLDGLYCAVDGWIASKADA